MVEIHIRGLPKTTKAALEELATQKNMSLNKYVVSQLELIAKNKLTLETLEELHFLSISNTNVLLEVRKLLLEIGGGFSNE